MLKNAVGLLLFLEFCFITMLVLNLIFNKIDDLVLFAIVLAKVIESGKMKFEVIRLQDQIDKIKERVETDAENKN